MRSQVYERDGLRCHLCGFTVDRSAPARHPRLASVDHLVLHRDGGDNDPANLRTAHLWCNMLRCVAPVQTARAALRGVAPPEEWDSAQFAFLHDLIPGSAPRSKLKSSDLGSDRRVSRLFSPHAPRSARGPR